MVEFDFGANWWQFVLIAIGGYFVGCFNFAVLIAKLKKRDVTKIGSGNPGSMNMTREFGPVVGFTNFFLDTFKAGIPALIVYYSYANAEFAGTNFCVGWFAAFLCGLFVVVGHVFPVTMKFKGGKGLASGLGMFWMLLGVLDPWNWLYGFLVICTIPIVITLTKVGSLFSMSYLAGYAVWFVALLLGKGDGSAFYAATLLMAFAVVALVWAAHHKNVRCMLAGEEHATVMLKFKKKAKKS